MDGCRDADMFASGSSQASHKFGTTPKYCLHIGKVGHGTAKQLPLSHCEKAVQLISHLVAEPH